MTQYSRRLIEIEPTITRLSAHAQQEKSFCHCHMLGAAGDEELGGGIGEKQSRAPNFEVEQL